MRKLKRPILRIGLVGGFLAWSACSGGAGPGAATEEALTVEAPAPPRQADARPGRAASTAVEAAPMLGDTALQRLVREIQPAVERSAGIAASRPLHVAATDEARLRRYLEEQLGQQLSPERARAITATYARLGLVPDTLDLRALLMALLQEQVVGYYDPVTDTLFVHERVGVAELEPVLAHELVHALQDQRFALDSLTRALKDRNDASTASQAALEGHATYAMMEWQFGALTGAPADLTTLPDLGATLGSIDLTALGDFGSADVLAKAPAVIREGLIFPYVGGLIFVQRAWTSERQRPLPFGDRLPQSTEQILHVERWLDPDLPTEVAFTAELEDWTATHAGDLGELETRLFLEEHLGDRGKAAAAAAGWDGDAYRLLRGPAGEALVWVSVWDTEAEADEFAEAARAAYARRYPRGGRNLHVQRDTVEGRPVVRILDLPPGADRAPALGAVRLVGGG